MQDRERYARQYGRATIVGLTLAGLALAGCTATGTQSRSGDAQMSPQPSMVALASTDTGDGEGPRGPDTTTTMTTYTDPDCVTQITVIAAKTNASTADVQDAISRLCNAAVKLTSTESAVTPAEATQVANDEGMSSVQTAAIVAAASSGTIHKSSWRHEYWVAAVGEFHTGTTYWDGSKAWITTYRGKTGSHKCHTQGGWAVGAGVSVTHCSKPGAGSSADAVENFDLSLLFKGFPVTLDVGLHYKVSKTGAKSAWQVGG